MDFKYWLNHFKANQVHMDNIIDDPAHSLSRKEIGPYINSIQQMQRGEHSEGHNLFRMAKAYALKSKNFDYKHIIKLFIKEEQNHASVLARFLDIHEIPKIREHWVDGVFRKLRKVFNLKYAIATLLIAETIALVYYDCLYKSTSSPMLKAICNQVLKDEHYHVLFQIETLQQFKKEGTTLTNSCLALYQNILMNGTLLIVWLYHKNVLRNGQLNLFSFYKSVKQELKNYHSQVSSSHSLKNFSHAST